MDLTKELHSQESSTLSENHNAQESNGEGNSYHQMHPQPLQTPVWQMQPQTAAVPLVLNRMMARMLERNEEPLE